jgi:hypothetical protein
MSASFFAHAFDAAQASGARGRFEVVERADVQLAVEQRDGLRSDPLQPENVEDGWRKLRRQLAVVGELAGLDELVQLLREILAEPRQRGARFHREVRDRLGVIGHAVGRGAIRTDLERVLAFQFEQVGDLAKDAGD